MSHLHRQRLAQAHLADVAPDAAPKVPRKAKAARKAPRKAKRAK